MAGWEIRGGVCGEAVKWGNVSVLRVARAEVGGEVCEAVFEQVPWARQRGPQTGPSCVGEKLGVILCVTERTINLYENRNHPRDPGDRFPTTDANGNYSFPNLAPGTYVVAEEPQPGWVQTAPAGRTYTVTVASGQIISGEDFGNKQST